MSTSTSLSRGTIYKLEGTEVSILDIHGIEGLAGVIHYNPGLARDNKDNIWISIRSCSFPKTPVIEKGFNHPMHYQNHLHVGKLDEKTLKVSDVKEIQPEEKYEGHQWGIEDVRLFWREDGLHGIGVILPVRDGDYRTCLAEILIDHDKGTYKLLNDFGQPFKHPEKNWMPAAEPARLFDFIYSPSQIVLEGEIYGEENALFIHGGTPLLDYQNGYISIGHIVLAVKGQRTYAQIGQFFNKRGELKQISQFFHLDVGWREGLQESIEFVSGAIWSKGKEGQQMLIGIGIKDELTGVAKLDVDLLKWQPYGDIGWYGWNWDTPPSRVELPTPKKT
jgi:hypothetical protein